MAELVDVDTRHVDRLQPTQHTQLGLRVAQPVEDHHADGVLDGGGEARAPEDASQGRTPRFFTLAPFGSEAGPWMYVLGEDSDTLECWHVDAATGLPQPTGHAVGCGSPVCMVFKALDAG